MTEYSQGQAHREAGYSIHYNPYRHRGSAEQYIEWERGWKAADERRESGFFVPEISL